MKSEEFRHFWNANFPECPPVGYLVRDMYRDRWFRIHTLPESKQYPDTEAEYQEILRRHNRNLGDLLGSDPTFLLVTTGLSWDEETAFPEELLATLNEVPTEFALRVPIYDDVAEEFQYFSFWISNMMWEPHLLDPLLRLVAQHEYRNQNVGIVNVKHPSFYFPYNGGGDIFLASSSERDEMRSRYSDWLSAHYLGL